MVYAKCEPGFKPDSHMSQSSATMIVHNCRCIKSFVNYVGQLSPTIARRWSATYENQTLSLVFLYRNSSGIIGDVLFVGGHWRRKFIRKDKAFYSPVTTDTKYRQ